jgi:hypothetical protein
MRTCRSLGRFCDPLFYSNISLTEEVESTLSRNLAESKVNVAPESIANNTHHAHSFTNGPLILLLLDILPGRGHKISNERRNRRGGQALYPCGPT